MDSSPAARASVRNAEHAPVKFLFSLALPNPLSSSSSYGSSDQCQPASRYERIGDAVEIREPHSRNASRHARIAFHGSSSGFDTRAILVCLVLVKRSSSTAKDHVAAANESRRTFVVRTVDSQDAALVREPSTTSTSRNQRN